MTCAQAILSVYGPSVGLSQEQARILGHPLCGISIGKYGICGYISAAALLLGMAKDKTEESISRADTIAAIDRLCGGFKEKNGHLHCKDLVGADMRTAEGKKAVKENGLIAKHCYSYGRDAASLLEDLI